jgi:hypothetical protein
MPLDRKDNSTDRCNEKSAERPRCQYNGKNLCHLTRIKVRYG